MATGTAAWLAAGQRRDRRGASRAVRLAADLDSRFEATRAALATGAVNLEQVEVVAAALRRLAKDVTVDQRAAAEAMLLDHAARLGPDDLRVLGRRLFEVIAPDAADEVEGKLLEDEEARVRARARMWMHPTGEGSTRGGFCIPDAHAAMLKTVLDSLTSPPSPAARGRRRRRAEASRDLPYEQRLALAFCELIEHLPVNRLPQSGRTNATVTVNIDLEALRSGLGAATQSTGTKISASQARRLACNAGIVPMVLSGGSVVLDLGRDERFHTRHQRTAMGRVQGGCIAEGCDRPPAWCEAHHPLAWAAGGRTDVHDDHGGVLLCPRHHHLVHQQGWPARIASDGIPELIPPAHIDPERPAVRHRRFRRRAPV